MIKHFRREKCHLKIMKLHIKENYNVVYYVIEISHRRTDPVVYCPTNSGPLPYFGAQQKIFNINYYLLVRGMYI